MNEATHPPNNRPSPSAPACSPYAIYSECPHCGSEMAPEHAHFRCTSCGWRDSCCD